MQPSFSIFGAVAAAVVGGAAAQSPVPSKPSAGKEQTTVNTQHPAQIETATFAVG